MACQGCSGPAHPAGESNHLTAAVADGADAVQGALDAGAVVAAEGAQAADHRRQVVAPDGPMIQIKGAPREAGLGQPAEVEHHLQQLLAAAGGGKATLHGLGQHGEQTVEVVGDPLGQRRSSGWRRGGCGGSQGDRLPAVAPF
jgi:hypothetical protein